MNSDQIRKLIEIVSESSQGVAEGLAQDESEQSHGWVADSIDEINYNTFEVHLTNTRSGESADLVIRPVDMMRISGKLQIETIDVRDLATGDTQSWTTEMPDPQGAIVDAIDALFWDNPQLNKKLYAIIDAHSKKGQDMLSGQKNRAKVGMAAPADQFIAGQDAIAKAKGTVKEFDAQGYQQRYTLYKDGYEIEKFSDMDNAIEYAENDRRDGDDPLAVYKIVDINKQVVWDSNPYEKPSRIQLRKPEQGVAEGKRTLRDYIAESERAYSRPVRGDNFAINIREECLLETWVCDETVDGIVLHADNRMIEMLHQYGYLQEGDISQLQKSIADAPVAAVAAMETGHDVADAGEYDFEGDMAKDDLATIVRAARRLTGMLDDNENMPEWVQSKINKAADYVDTAADYVESNKEQDMAEGFNSDLEMELHQLTKSPDIYDAIYNALGRNDPVGQHLQDMMYDVARENRLHPDDDIEQIIDVMADRLEDMYGDPDISEAKYQGRTVPLGKPMKGDVKKSKVYVKGPKGNVVKVNFGQKGMKIKKSIPGRRKNFRARHNCDNPGPRWKARYWSCRAW